MKKILALIILAVFIVPLSGAIPIPGGQPVWYGQYLALLLISFLGASLIIWDFNKFLSMFIIVCLFSTFFITAFSPRAIILLYQLIVCSLIAYSISKFNEKQRKYLRWAILGFMGLQFLWLLLQSMHLDPIFHYRVVTASGVLEDKAKDMMVGFSGSSDQLGTFFAITFPLAIFYLPFTLLSIPALIVSKSSFAFVSVVIPAFIYVWFNNRQIFYLMVIIVILASLLFFSFVDKLSMADFGVRFAVWRHAVLATIKGEITIERDGSSLKGICNPIFGYGFGRWLSIFPFVPEQGKGMFRFNYEDEKFAHAHNDYVELFFELGWLGLVSVLLLVGNFLWVFVRSRKNKELILYFCCIVAYLLNSLGNFLAQMAVSGLLLIIFYGLYEGVRKELNSA